MNNGRPSECSAGRRVFGRRVFGRRVFGRRVFGRRASAVAFRARTMNLPRGISPDLLVSQVRNTAPYLFDDPPGQAGATTPAGFVRAYASAPRELGHAEYFRLCLSAHYLTCATPVPTDVDNQIRKKLWPDGLPLATALEMAGLVLESRSWDFEPLTSRSSGGAIGSDAEHVRIHGHYGEWFTVAVGAYAALARYRADEARALREKLLAALEDETDRHSRVFGSAWRAGDGLRALLATVSIAHNFGDLDRVIEMWDVNVADPLRLRLHHSATKAFSPEGKLRHEGRLWAAGELYKSIIDGSSMAGENHRHFALRKPRALRTRPELRVPIGPFFDAWGERVAQLLEGEDLLEVVRALAHGAERLKGSIGYLRALRAITLAHPSLRAEVAPLEKTIPYAKSQLATSREELEARWSAAALKHLDDIPSRA
jgi:hypothetical protein